MKTKDSKQTNAEVYLLTATSLSFWTCFLKKKKRIKHIFNNKNNYNTQDPNIKLLPPK